MKVLVVGATGRLGEPVARRMRADGLAVRILARDPERARSRFPDGFEVVPGDVTRPETLRAALEGCAGVHLSLRGTNTLESYMASEAQGTANVAGLARECGVRRISYVAGAGDLSRAQDFPLTRVKTAAMAAVRESGVEWTVFKPTHFMESLPLFVRGSRATVIGRQPHKYHYVAAQDFAGQVSRSFGLAEAARRELVVFGPEPYTMEEALRVYCSACRPGVSVSTMPLLLFRALAALKGSADMKFAAQLFAGFARIGEDGDPRETDSLLGAATTPLAEWCAGQREPQSRSGTA